MEFYLPVKKEENFTLCNSMDGPGEHYAKWKSQSEKDKYHMISLICGMYEWNANEQTDPTSKRETDL